MLFVYFSISGISIPRETPAPSTTEGSSQVPFSSPATGVGARPKYSKVERESTTLEKKDNSFTGECSRITFPC